MEHSRIIKKAKDLNRLIDNLNADIIADKPKSILVNRYKELLDLKKSCQSLHPAQSRFKTHMVNRNFKD